MKTEIEYENFLAKAVANNHGKDHVLMPLMAHLSLGESSDGGVSLPKLLTAHSSWLRRAKEDAPFSVGCMSCHPVNAHANFFITGHHFVPALTLFGRAFLH